MMDKKLQKIFNYLRELFPRPETELHYSTPFQLLVAVMLSAQATDKQVNKVTDVLFQKITTPQDLIKLGFTPFQKAISSVNYYKTKTKHIFATSQLLASDELRVTNYEKKNNNIPSDITQLQKLPGIGVKTAKLIAHILYDKPYIAVDTHIHRVANRLGLVKTTAPEKTSELLEKIIPDEYKDLAHHALVLFGRYYCTAKNPKCITCKLKNICLYYKKNYV